MTEVRRKPTLGVLILGVALLAALLALFRAPTLSLAGQVPCFSGTGPPPVGPSALPPCETTTTSTTSTTIDYPLDVPLVEGSADSSEGPLPALDAPAGSDSGFPVGIAAVAAVAVLIQVSVGVAVKRRRSASATVRS